LTGIQPKEAEVGYHPNLTVKVYKGGSVKPRKYYYVQGLNSGNLYKAYNNSIYTMARAVNERLFYIHEDGVYKIPPKPLPGRFDDTCTFTALLDKLGYYATKMTQRDFVDSYAGSKKLRYQAAVELFNRQGIRRKDGYWKTFVKYEMYDFDDKSDPVPRGINPRSDVYLVELGRYLRPIEKRIYEAIDKVYGYRVVLKGLNNQQRGKIIAEHFRSIRDPVCVPLDASRFEQSCSEEVLHWEHRRYMKYYPGDKYFKKLLAWQRSNKGHSYCTDGELKFAISGGRGSGDFNTGLGNNMITAKLVGNVMEILSIDNYKFFCDGDDACVVISRNQYNHFVKYAKTLFREYGFRMKLGDPAYDIERIDFCSARPVFDGSDYCMVRSPAKLFGKDTISRHDLSSRKNWKDWAYAVGMCHLHLGGGYPVQQSFANVFLRSTDSKTINLKYLDEWKMGNAWKDMVRENANISERARYSYWLAFGLTPDEQIAIEHYLDNLTIEYDKEFIAVPKMCESPFSRVATNLPGI